MWGDSRYLNNAGPQPREHSRTKKVFGTRGTRCAAINNESERHVGVTSAFVCHFALLTRCKIVVESECQRPESNHVWDTALFVQRQS